MLNTVLNKISRETDRIDKLHSKMDILKIHDQQRCESSTRLVESMQNLRLETEQSYHTIGTLEADLDITKELLRQQERTCANLKSEAAVKDDTISRLQANIVFYDTESPSSPKSFYVFRRICKTNLRNLK